ncbi:hypothetical protein ORV05_04050 [Amycolatopsis cynarae]|uniref:Uncharacterized protein n=2 Tax=Amycolatopsis TaxID=1813 RepID=A0A558BR37_9PSEU|nr:MULTISPECIES: hypothetical protein [Amycolatopsis]TVT38953.1 hypothetical protein FNH05_23945 [Amycolatopsis rhizosphaerae]WAL66978.1 hypothetical protein ORV05_04050 [Amycolatopsis sp. HUAS 11-8]
MRARSAVAAGLVLLAVVAGTTGCRGQSASGGGGASPAPAASELDGIRTTLDAIDSEMAGDGSP